jgi:hypothetical protein
MAFIEQGQITKNFPNEGYAEQIFYTGILLMSWTMERFEWKIPKHDPGGFPRICQAP